MTRSIKSNLEFLTRSIKWNTKRLPHAVPDTSRKTAFVCRPATTAGMATASDRISVNAMKAMKCKVVTVVRFAITARMGSVRSRMFVIVTTAMIWMETESVCLIVQIVRMVNAWVSTSVNAMRVIRVWVVCASLNVNLAANLDFVRNQTSVNVMPVITV